MLAAIDAVMDQSERLARKRVLAMPDGVYEAESFMDDDGVSIGTSVPRNGCLIPDLQADLAVSALRDSLFG